MSDVFTALEPLLLEGDSLTFKISRRGKNLVALVIPVLPPAPPSLPPEVEQLRAGLSMYLRLEMSAGELDAEFSERVRGYGAAREEPRRAYDRLLDELKETNKAAQTAAANAAGKRKGPPAPAKALEGPGAANPSETTAPAKDSPAPSGPPTETDQPLSLF